MPLPAAVTAGLPFVSDAMNFMFTQMANRQQQQWNEKMYDRQNADNLRLWNMNNEYNSPAAQMGRLRAAGLNPNLVYGQGAVANSAGAVRAASPGGYTPAVPRVDLARNLSQFQDLKNAGLQNNLMQKQLELMNEEIRNKRIQGDNMLLDGTNKTVRNSSLSFDLQFKQQMQETNKKILLQRLTNMSTQNDISLGMFDINQSLGRQQLSIRPMLANASVDLMRQQFGFNEKMNPKKLDAAQQGIYNQITQRLLMNSQMQNNEVQREHVRKQITLLGNSDVLQKMEIKLKSLGATWNDPIGVRLAAKTAEYIDQGIEVDAAAEKAFNDVRLQWQRNRGGGGSW